jgi:hypothetical protein
MPAATLRIKKIIKKSRSEGAALENTTQKLNPTESA